MQLLLKHRKPAFRLTFPPQALQLPPHFLIFPRLPRKSRLQILIFCLNKPHLFVSEPDLQRFIESFVVWQAVSALGLGG